MTGIESTAYAASKRCIDVVLAALTLLLLSPVLLVIALLVRLHLGRGVLFSQERLGRDERIFRIYKFRTMLDPAPDRGLVSDADRLTRFGRILRSTSLDELPGLVNVLAGQMSIVGPRPFLAEWRGQYCVDYSRRHKVRPGITGLAQVRGRNAISFEERLSWDLRYVDSRCHLTDVAILLRTIVVVVRRSGITTPGYATYAPFPNGSTSERKRVIESATLA